MLDGMPLLALLVWIAIPANPLLTFCCHPVRHPKKSSVFFRGFLVTVAKIGARSRLWRPEGGRAMRTALRSQVWVLILMQDFLDRSRGGAQSSGREEVLLRLLQKKRKLP